MPLFASRVLIALTLAVAALSPATSAFAQDEAAAKAKALLPAIQKKLASGSDLLKVVRIDGFEATGKGLKVNGVFLCPPFVKDESKGTPTDVMRNELISLLRAELGSPNLSPDLRGIKEVFPIDHPHIVLMAAANEAGAKGDRAADEVVLTASRFDEKGNLVLDGLRSKDEAAAQWLTAAIKAFAAKKPPALAGGPSPEGPGNVRAVEWTLSVPETQKWLAESKDPTLQRLRIDRVFVAFDAKNENPTIGYKTLIPRVEGIRIGTEAINGDAVQAHLSELTTKLLGGTKGVKATGLDARALVDSWVDEAQLVEKLRKAVAADHWLDGLRIDAGATFGPTGRLQLAGLRPPLSVPYQQNSFEQLVISTVKAALMQGGDDPTTQRVKKLGAGPAATIAAMTEADTPALLAKLRAWVGKEKEDVRLSRLYFGSDGGLKLVCESPEKSVEDIQANLKQWAPQYVKDLVTPMPGNSDAPPKNEPPKEEKKKDGTEPILATQPKKAEATPAPQVIPPPGKEFPSYGSLTELLRAEVSKESDPAAAKKWNGVYIDRGYFDRNNRYTLRGVVDGDQQNIELGKMLAELKSKPEWKSYFSPTEPNRPALQVISMSDLLTRVQRVAPAYEDFDGFQISGASYRIEADPKTGKKSQVLTFTAHMVTAYSPSTSAKLKRTAADKLTALVRADADHFGKRLPSDGRPVELITNPDQDDANAQSQVAHFTNGLGAVYLVRAEDAPFFHRAENLARAKRWIDAGLLHAPDQSSIWFLSAYYNFTLGDVELARRDLYRIIKIEEPIGFNGGDQRRRRYETAKDLQGTERTELERFWLKCWKEVNDGAKPMTMAAWFALKGRNFETLLGTGVPESVLARLLPLMDKPMPRAELVKAVDKLLTPAEAEQYDSTIVNHATMVPGK